MEIGWRRSASYPRMAQIGASQALRASTSPGEYCTNGVLRNIPEFYAAFNVQPGDKMYLPPEQRVRIW